MDLLSRGRDGSGRIDRGVAIRVELLEGRALLSGIQAMAHDGGHQAAMVSGHDGGDPGKHDAGNGEVRKDPHFYEFYIGPRRADLDVVAARAELEPGRGIEFSGVMQGKIDTHPATSAGDSFYVFGVNRGSPNAVAPFFARPNIVFDAVVVVSVTHDGGTTGSVHDLISGATTNLSRDAIHIDGKQVRVTVNPSLLPTPAGGVPLSQYTFNLWPRSSLANPPTTPANHDSFVASFIPEDGMAPIHVPGKNPR